MEAAQRPGCGTPATGSFVYEDTYGLIYRVSWETTRSGFDVTTIIQDPRVPGQEADGLRHGHALFRRGLVTVDRQILQDSTDGYTIISAGGSQEVSLFQSSFPCGPQPTNPFCYHLDSMISEEVDGLMTCGPRWTDPDNPDDDVVTWGDIGMTVGDVIAASAQTFQWVNVWGQDDQLEATCL